ncbi:20535_t:CDS:2, partial [Rhizophagus irregularis]
MEYKINLTKEDSEKYLCKGKGIKLKIYNEDNKAISLKTIYDVRPPKKKKKRCLTCDNREHVKRTKSENKVERFINELLTPVNVEDLLIPEIQNVEIHDVEKLVERYISLGNTNGKNILIWYNIGQIFEREIKARINQTKPDQTAREELYDEMMEFIVNESTDEKQKKKEALRKRMQGAIKIYKLFTEIENDTKAKYVAPGAITQFRKLLYVEERIIELGEDEIVYLITSIDYEEPWLSIKEQNQRLDRYIQEIVQRFIKTKQFTREPEDSESDEAKDSPESYELGNTSDDEEVYEVRGEDNVEWTIRKLKGKIEEMGGRFTDKNIYRMWDLRIRMELILTEDFLGTFFELMGLSDEKLKDEINEWLIRETVTCEDCGNKKLPDMMEGPQQCRKCELAEVLELQDDLEKLGYELDILETRRIKELRISNSIILTTEFMEKYFQEIDSDDKELRIKLYEWINENTTFCNECGIRWINNKFDEGKT